MKSTPENRHPDVLPALEGRLEVMLGLALEAPPPEGSCPSLEEIACWYERTLPPERVGQVKAHVARCRQCYAVWVGLLDCGCRAEAAEIALPGFIERAGAALKAWLDSPRLWAPIATGLAAAGLAAGYLVVSGDSAWIRTIDRGYEHLASTVVQSAPEASRWSWGSGLGARGIDNPWDRLADLRVSHLHDAARAAFGAGVRAGLSESLHDTSEWAPVVAALPAEPPACTRSATPEACEEINKVFLGVGRWAVLLHFACLLDRQPTAGGQPDAAFWQEQIGVLGKAGSGIDAHLPEDAFGRFFSDWQAETSTTDDPRTALCAREASLLSLGLD